MKRGRGDSSRKILSRKRACEECTTNCLLFHKKVKDPSGPSDRFFKVMVQNFSEALFLPQKFSRQKELSKFIGWIVCLEDSIGQKYLVTLSEVHHYHAFKQGWHEFSVEHGLKLGDFVTFHLVQHDHKLHFYVHIYGPDGSEKLDFPQGVHRRESRTNKIAAVPNQALKDQPINFAKKQNPGPLVVPNSRSSSSNCQLETANNVQGYDILELDPAPVGLEEPLYMLNRDCGQFEDDRTCLRDLSSFEKQRNGPAVAEVNIMENRGDATIKQAGKILKRQKDSVQSEISPLEFSSPEALPYVAKIDLNETTNESAPVDVTPLGKLVDGGESSICHAEKMMKCQSKSGSVERIPVQRDVLSLKTPSYLKEIDINENINDSGPVSPATDTRWKDATADNPNIGFVISSEKPEENMNKQAITLKNVQSSSVGEDKDFKIPKTKSISSRDITASLGPRETSLAVVDEKSFLKLESPLPSALSRGAKWRPIYLRAPDNRVWTNVYHERNGVQVLTTAGQILKSNYHLRPGDRCLLELEDGQERKYRVNLIRG